MDGKRIDKVLVTKLHDVNSVSPLPKIGPRDELSG
jgi:hypothetical protein